MRRAVTIAELCQLLSPVESWNELLAPNALLVLVRRWAALLRQDGLRKSSERAHAVVLGVVLDLSQPQYFH